MDSLTGACTDGDTHGQWNTHGQFNWGRVQMVDTHGQFNWGMVDTHGQCTDGGHTWTV